MLQRSAGSSVDEVVVCSQPECVISYFFFFQAEDGIRDVAVTGVQTCALPISYRLEGESRLVGGRRPVAAYTEVPIGDAGGALASGCLGRSGCVANGIEQLDEIGRGSWRGRGEISVGGGLFKKKKKR